jgi:hypothetical protein
MTAAATVPDFSRYVVLEAEGVGALWRILLHHEPDGRTRYVARVVSGPAAYVVAETLDDSPTAWASIAAFVVDEIRSDLEANL